MDFLLKCILDTSEPRIVQTAEAAVKGRTVVFAKYVRRLDWFGTTYESPPFYECWRKDDENRGALVLSDMSFEDFQAEVTADPKFYGV